MDMIAFPTRSLPQIAALTTGSIAVTTFLFFSAPLLITLVQVFLGFALASLNWIVVNSSAETAKVLNAYLCSPHI